MTRHPNITEADVRAVMAERRPALLETIARLQAAIANIPDFNTKAKDERHVSRR